MSGWQTESCIARHSLDGRGVGRSACHSPPEPLNTSRTSSGPFAPNPRQCVQSRLLSRLTCCNPPQPGAPANQFEPPTKPIRPATTIAIATAFSNLDRPTRPRPRMPLECSGLSTQRDSMHPFSILTLGIFVAGYITARWDLVTRLYELAVFAWDYGVVVSSRFPPSAPRSTPFTCCATGTANMQLLTTNLALHPAQSRATKGFAVLSLVFVLIFIPVERLATREGNLVRPCKPPSPLPSSGLESMLIITPQHPRSTGSGISAREQLRRRGSF